MQQPTKDQLVVFTNVAKTLQLPSLRGYLVGSIALPSKAEAQSRYMSLAAVINLVLLSCKQEKKKN